MHRLDFSCRGLSAISLHCFSCGHMCRVPFYLLFLVSLTDVRLLSVCLSASDSWGQPLAAPTADDPFLRQLAARLREETG